MSDDELRRLLESAHADDRVRARIRERWLRQQASEDATMAGVLVDLAQARAAVALRTTSGRVHQGELRVDGIDHCTIVSVAGEVHVRLDAVVLVRPAPGVRAPVAATSTEAGEGRRLLDLLVDAAADRPRVALVAAGSDDLVTGRLDGVGADVLTLRLEPAGRCYVAVQSVTEISFLASG